MFSPTCACSNLILKSINPQLSKLCHQQGRGVRVRSWRCQELVNSLESKSESFLKGLKKELQTRFHIDEKCKRTKC